MLRSIAATATALAAAAAGLAGTAQPASAALGDVPADCSVFATAYRSDGQRLSYKYGDRKTSTAAIDGDRLGWVPTALAGGAESGSDDNYMSQNLVTHPTDGYLYLLTRWVKVVDGVEMVVQQSTKRLAPGFAGTRLLTSGRFPYYYRIAGNSLYRFKVVYTADKPPTISTPEKLPGDDWDTVTTLLERRTGGTPEAPIHVLLGTKTNGQLVEYQIDEASPATITSKVLSPSGWETFTSLSTSGFCATHPDGDPLLGITAEGSASVYFDANSTDGDGADIKGGTLGDLNWTEKAY
ncbi:hypothetical protein [Kribbella sp. DT2]|uniref:hypothetical protein n=1 Tax=Kribbella sp. DT2 TaxID=3393427 RepID=UPI003CF1B952